MSRPDVIGVVGAGTMGAGIAQLGCQAGEETVLFDADPRALADARVTTLYEGTSQIQKLIIGRAATGENAMTPLRGE